MKNILKNGLNKASEIIHENSKNKGFWDNYKDLPTKLMLCVSEIAEIMEADRIDKRAEPKDRFNWFDDWNNEKSFDKLNFEDYFKNTVEDEIADSIIRLLDLSFFLGIDIEWHINMKHTYNETRPKGHGKKY